jgi:glycosyltransferase involved in cell wall biosynthesis
MPSVLKKKSRMQKHIVMIIANSPDPSYFKWFTALNKKEKQFKLTYIFLLTEPTHMEKYYRDEGIHVHWLYFNYARSKYFQFIRVTFQLYRLFLKIKPDVVQTNLFDDSLTGLFAARLAGVKKRIATKQDTGYHILYFPRYIKLDKFINWNATNIIPSSGETKELIMKYENPPENKVRIIHHGMSEAGITSATPEQVKAFKQKYHLENKIVIGSVSRYIELKGYRYIIAAAKIAVQKYPNIHFLFIGTGDQKDELALLIAMNKLENYITITGRIDFSEIPTAYKSMDIFIHASEVEAFGFVFAEAMFNKVPMISTRVGAVRDVLTHKENIYMTKFKDPVDIAEGINFMMQADRQQIAEKAYLICKDRFAIEIMWENYKNLFNS